jgi:hypothetical protein
MMRALIVASLVLLSACAGPDLGDNRSEIADDLPAPMVEAAPEAPIAAAPVTPDILCDDPGDGIGGTGCPVD